MTTAEAVFNIAMAIADELSTNGTISPAETAEYRHKTPSILTLLEAEYVLKGHGIKKYTVSTGEEPFLSATGGYVRVAMPDDFYTLENVRIESDSGSLLTPYYSMESGNTMLIRANFKGTLIIEYRPVPSAISEITDALTVDDITARTLLPYALCAELFKEENENIYNHCMLRLRELNQNHKKQATFTETVDVYRW